MKFIDKTKDAWHTITGEDGPMVTLTPAPYSLLTLTQWHGVRSTWPADMPVGVIYANDADIEDLADDLPRLALVALQFPKWTDGRAYSQAHLLRSRYRFKGEVRAQGEVLVDMLQLLQRTGFSAVSLRGDQSLDAAERALRLFSGFYQGDVTERRPLFGRPAGQEYSQEDFVNAGASI
jgi:uncharacterized protein (DUF934 family)